MTLVYYFIFFLFVSCLVIMFLILNYNDIKDIKEEFKNKKKKDKISIKETNINKYDSNNILKDIYSKIEDIDSKDIADNNLGNFYTENDIKEFINRRKNELDEDENGFATYIDDMETDVYVSNILTILDKLSVKYTVLGNFGKYKNGVIICIYI